MASERGLSLLSDLAELYVGDPVKVGAMPSAAKALGNADYTPDGWVIGLRSDLWGNPAELALTFLHEVAHVVLGHVAAKVATGPRYDLDELEHAASALDGKASGDLAALLVARVKAHEQAADTWARIELARLDERIQADQGQTFAEALAVLG